MEPGFNASRKADREKIAAGFVAVAEKLGAAITRRDETPTPGYCGEGIYLSFSLNGVGAQIDISDLHGGDYGLISWFNDYSAQPRPDNGEYWKLVTHRFERGFEVAVGSSSDARPHHKATSHGPWDILAARLQAGLRKARDGKAFIPLTETAEA